MVALILGAPRLPVAAPGLPPSPSFPPASPHPDPLPVSGRPCPSPTGFPFLKLAQRHGLTYGDVLMFTEWWNMNCPPDEAPTHVREHLQHIWPAAATKLNDLMKMEVRERGQ